MKKNHLLRQCIVCRAMKERSELIRIVKNEDGIFVDSDGKAGGRGAWICNADACKELFVKKRALDRPFHCRVPEERYAELSTILRSLNG